MKVLALTYKDSTDYLGNLILKNAHPSQYLFEGGYASFDADTLDGWHYYVQDYMGNNRMVVNLDGTVEQETHYYPYGGVIGDLSTDESLQPYKFEGKELDRTFGLDWYDIQARQYDAIGVPSWNAVDPLAEKYYGISPYVYCAGDPVNNIDQKGDSVCPLLKPDGAKGMGHVAVLIQDEDMWKLYSKNGTSNSSGSYGPGDHDDYGDEKYSSPEEFLNSKDNRDPKTGDILYTEGIIIPCSKEDDQKAIEAAKKELNNNYNLIGSNCVVTVQKALNAAGLDDGSNPWTATGIRILSPTISFLYSKIPNDIYRRIKENNPGKVINVEQ